MSNLTGKVEFGIYLAILNWNLERIKVLRKTFVLPINPYFLLHWNEQQQKGKFKAYYTKTIKVAGKIII